MSNPAQHHKITYITNSRQKDIEQTKRFYSAVFGWSFRTGVQTISAFSAADAGIDGGFSKVEPHEVQAKPAALVVLYSCRPESHGNRSHRRRRRDRSAHIRVPGGRPLPTSPTAWATSSPCGGVGQFHRQFSMNCWGPITCDVLLVVARVGNHEIQPGVFSTRDPRPLSSPAGGSMSGLRGPSSSRTSVSPRMQRSKRSESRANKGASCSYSAG